MDKVTQNREYAKFGLVMILIILIGFGLFWLNDGQTLTELMAALMASFMTSFAGFKLVGYRQFVSAFSGYDIIAKRFRVYALAFPWLQLCLGLSYFLVPISSLRNWLVIAIAGLAALGVWQTVIRGKTKLSCACLGRVIKLPLSKLSLAEDLAMLVMAGLMQF